MADAKLEQTLKELGILPDEYKQIVTILGREPNYTELSIYSVMWSEHASYKNSIKWIKKLPRTGKHLLAEAGVRFQDRVAQPSVCRRTLSGGGYGSRWYKSRHFYHGGTPRSATQFAPLWQPR